MSIYSGDGFGGSLLGSVSKIFGSTPGTNPISFDVSGLGISLTAGNVYTFGISSFTGSQQILSSDANPYADGIQYNNPTFYGSTPTWDLMFQTHVDTAVVPIPAAAWLFGSGLLGLVGIARRKNA